MMIIDRAKIRGCQFAENLSIDFFSGKGRVDMNFAVILGETKSQIHCF